MSLDPSILAKMANTPSVGETQVRPFRYVKARDEHGREYDMPLTAVGVLSDEVCGILIKIFRYELQQIVREEMAALEERIMDRLAGAPKEV